VIEITRTDDIAGRQYMRLSGGQQRRVQYALAICGGRNWSSSMSRLPASTSSRVEMQWDTIRALLARRTASRSHHALPGGGGEELADRVIMLAEGRVIAHGTVDEMCALVPRKTLSCHTSIGLERIASWPEVGEATIDRKGLLTLVVSDAEAVAASYWRR
jgi:ABC-2 type transport system ATP-binding protein